MMRILAIIVIIISTIFLVLWVSRKYCTKIEKTIVEIVSKFTGDPNVNIIQDKLWLGNMVASLDHDFYQSNNINVVINCTKNIPFIQQDITKYRIPVNDDLKDKSNDKMLEYLDDIITKIDAHLKNGDRILVHCAAGKQRSATVVVAYLMKYQKMSKKEAINFVRQRRPWVFSGYIHFDRALSTFENILKP